MHARLAFAALATLIGLGSAARADIYGAGPAYGGNPTNGIATCRIINVGLSAVNITTRQIINNVNGVQPLASDSCNVAMGPGGNCSFAANIGGNFALSCRVIVQGIDPQISGTIDVQNPVGSVRVVVPMQNTNN